MDSKLNLEMSKALPFHACSFFTISQMFRSNKDKMLDKLEDNNFKKNMLEHMSNISKDNYTCGYFDEQGIHNLSKKHKKDSLKMFHANIESFNTNGAHLAIYLKTLNLSFDIICLSEIRNSSIGIIDKEFPNYNIFLDNPTAKKVELLYSLEKINSIK